MIRAADVLDRCGRAPGTRYAVISGSGGGAALATDNLAQTPFEAARLSDASLAALADAYAEPQRTRPLARVAVDDSWHVAITLGGGMAHMRKVIAAVKSNAAPLSDDVGLRRVAKFVPKKRNTEIYFAVDQLGKLIGRIAKAVGNPFPYTIPEINAPVAMVTSLVPPAGTQTDVYIPIELITAIKDAITNAMGQQMNADPPAS